MDIKIWELSNYFSTDAFYDKTRRRLNQCAKDGTKVSIATLDINHFNFINDLFGYATGDLVLQKLTELFSNLLSKTDFFTRIHADVFAFCLGLTDYQDALKSFEALTNWQTALRDILPQHYNLSASGGIMVVGDDSSPVSALLDKVNYARQKAKGTMNSSFRFYDEKMSDELQWQKVVTFSMESALKNHEFEMFLQPKVYMKSDQIVGAEALVRWRSPQYGLIQPDRFIPILEQNGFIRQLDFFMLREACRFLKESESNGIPQIPISVNFSKVHLSTESLVKDIFTTVSQMGINTKLIEIEFTESLSVEGFERLIEVVRDLKMLGFSVSLDDFGSAYSSLNCLKELPIDIIKIDKAFLNSSSDSEKGQMIISKVVEMIKSLRMLSVMEGVETGEQVDFLRKMNCDFGQGYFYAKPMPVTDYISFLKKGNLLADIQTQLLEQVDHLSHSYRHVIPQEFQMDNWELYTLGKNIDMGLMKGYLDGDATVQYVNDRALEYLGYSRQEFREIFHNSIVAFTHPDDAIIVQEDAKQLVKTGKPLKFMTRAIRKDGKIVYLQGRSSCVIDDHGRAVGLHAFQDVTDDLIMMQSLQSSLTEKIKELEDTVEAVRKSREELRFSEERYRMIVEQSEDIMFDWDFETDTIFLSDNYVKLFGQKPFMENLTKSNEIRERIHPADLSGFDRWVSSVYRNSGHHMVEFRCKGSNGKYIWLRARSSTICDDYGNALRSVGLLLNIDSQKNEFAALTLKSQRDPLTQLLNKEETKVQTNSLLESDPTVPGLLFMMDIDNFKGINDTRGHQFGDTVIVEFTHCIREFFPANSIVGRIGGDEFAVYLPNVEPTEAVQTADALMKILRVNYNGVEAKYDICGSVGIACFPSDGKTFCALYRAADIALYESKRAGKHCYTIYKNYMAASAEDLRTPMEYCRPLSDIYFEGDISFEIFEMLYETKDLNTSIHMILELLGKHYGVDHVYIFQNDPEGQFAAKTHEWRAASTTPLLDALPKIYYKNLGSHLSDYSNDGIFCCDDVRTISPEVLEICQKQHIKSLLHCAILDEGVMVGFVGFNMRVKYHNWTKEEVAVLRYLSRIFSVFLFKSNASQELTNSCQNYSEMLENLNGYVYVIEPTTHKVLYINSGIKALGLDSTKPCYKMIFGASTPCTDCPMLKLSEKATYATSEFFAPSLHGWVNAAASKLKWDHGTDAVLINCTNTLKKK